VQQRDDIPRIHRRLESYAAEVPRDRVEGNPIGLDRQFNGQLIGLDRQFNV
jgi:hypothetical protein